MSTFPEAAPRLAAVGYEPIPILPGEKRPAMPGWQDGCPPARWREFRSGGVGLLTRNLPALDIDVTDPKAADAIQRLVDRFVGVAPPLVRYGAKPKRLMPFRLAGQTFHKLKLSWRLDGTEGAVEVLADGQQFVAFGTHPNGVAYRWERGDPLTEPRDLQPALDEAAAKRLLGHVERALVAAGAIIGQSVLPKPATRPRGFWGLPRACGNSTRYVAIVLGSIDDALEGDRHDTARKAAMKLWALVKDRRLDEAEAIAGMERHALPRLAERNPHAEKELAGIIEFARTRAMPDWKSS